MLYHLVPATVVDVEASDGGNDSSPISHALGFEPFGRVINNTPVLPDRTSSLDSEHMTRTSRVSMSCISNESDIGGPGESSMSGKRGRECDVRVSVRH